jgi:hypothetical protein
VEFLCLQSEIESKTLEKYVQITGESPMRHVEHDLKTEYYVTVEFIQKILQGQIYVIAYAFPWDETPQGDDYWAKIHFEDAELTEEARVFLRRMVHLAEDGSEDYKPGMENLAVIHKRTKV